MPLNNFGLVDKRANGASLWRAAQPDSSGFKLLVDLGIDGVFKLNNNAEFPDARETQYVEPAFVSLVPMDPFTPDEKFVRGVVKEIDAALTDGTSVFVHCTHGRDRTGLVIGAYRALINHWTFGAIQKERMVYGANWLVDVPDHEIVEMLKLFAKEGIA